jgi:hypothetical protein
MTRVTLVISISALCLLLLCVATGLAQETRARTDHAAAARGLSSQLRWKDAASHKEYLARRDDVTRRLLKEIDGFVTDSFQPGTATPDHVKAGLKLLLGHLDHSESYMSNAAIPVTLPKGRFLIAGVELLRGGTAIAEDAISFRAFKDAGSRFVFVTSTEDLHSSNPDNPYLAGLYAKPLSASPIVGEFWFLALAVVPPRAPPTVAMRLCAFDGESFRTVWAPKDIEAEGTRQAIELTSDGFIVNSLSDPTGAPVLSPSVATHTQYTVGPDGPKKTAEWRTQFP